MARLRSRRRQSRACRQLETARRAGLARQAAGPSGDRPLPAISVVTPSYNQGRFLPECIESVLGQNYPALEYLIVDGGSTDQSVEVIRRHADRLAFWVSEPDHGQSDAINKGLARASGDLVAWINADDCYLPGSFLAVAEAYRRDPGASFYYGDGFRVGEDGSARAAFFPDGPRPYDEAAMVFGMNYILQPAAFMSRASLGRAGHLDPDLHFGLDTDLWIRLARVAPPVPVAAYLALQREYETTKTASGSFERIEELRRIAERYAGVSMTPGVLCYFLDTLDRLSAERGDVFPPHFRRRIHEFWAAASRLLPAYGAGRDGFPPSNAKRRGVNTGSARRRREAGATAAQGLPRGR